MVVERKFIHRIEQLCKIVYNNSIIVRRESMAGKCTERFEQCDEGIYPRLCSMESSGPRSRTRYRRLQSTCYNFLERPSGVLSVSYHFTLFGLVVVGLVFAVLETMDELKHNEGLLMGTYVLEVFLLVVFTSEYVLRMWSAGCRSTYSGLLGRLLFAFKPFVVVDMIVIGSTFGVIVYSSNTNFSSTVSILRFFQVLRMVRFDRQGGSWKLVGSVLFLHRQELLTTFYIGFCSLIFASFFVFQAEQTDNPAEFGTFADSFWWGVVTLTTVGYGDKVPKSWAGRGVAAFFAIMGISFFALPAGILGSGFALKVSQHHRQKHVKRRRRPAAMLIQCNWRYYASQENSKLHGTWSPYIKYLQEKNVNHVVEKPAARMRKISIFGRKISGLPSDGLGKPAGSSTPEEARRRGRKAQSELSNSIDSLQDVHSYSEQHTDDDEHGSTHVRQKPILVIDAEGRTSLPAAYKQSIRFTRYLKFLVALRKFKLAKKPYDVKDVIEQYSTGHVEVLGKVKSIGNKIDEALGYKSGTENVSDMLPAKTNVVHRLSKLEKQMRCVEGKLDLIINLLEVSKRKSTVPSLSEEQPMCFVCTSKQEQIVQSQENLQEMENQVRKRKLGTTFSGQSLKSFCEQGETAVSKSDDQKFLSPNYQDGHMLSQHLSIHGMSNSSYPSPNTSSSDESFHDDDNVNKILRDSMLCDEYTANIPCSSNLPDLQDCSSDKQLPENNCNNWGVSMEPNRHGISGAPANYGSSNQSYLENSDTDGYLSPGLSIKLEVLSLNSDAEDNQDYTTPPSFSYQSPQDCEEDILPRNFLHSHGNIHTTAEQDSLPMLGDAGSLKPLPCNNYKLRPSADSMISKKSCDNLCEISPQSSDSEQVPSNQRTTHSSHGQLVYSNEGIQETTM